MIPTIHVLLHRPRKSGQCQKKNNKIHESKKQKNKIYTIYLILIYNTNNNNLIKLSFRLTLYFICLSRNLFDNALIFPQQSIIKKSFDVYC